MKLAKLIAGVIWFVAAVLLLASYTTFKVTLKDGSFDQYIQDQLPVQVDIQNAVLIELNRADIHSGTKLKVFFTGVIKDKRAQAPYSLELAYRFDMEGKKIYFEPFMDDQKLNGVDFAVANEVVPKLFEAFKSEPIHTVHKKGLVWLSVSDAKFSNENLKITISGFEVIELVLSIILFLAGTLVFVFVRNRAAGVD